MPTCSRITSTIHSANIPKAMIRELGNVELVELCETTPRVQCSHCLLYWNQGIVYCTCGQCLFNSESRRTFNKLRLDALSVPNYVVKKGRSHGAGHGKTWLGVRGRDAARKLTLKVNILQVFTMDFSEIQFIVNHNSQSDGDELAQEDHTYHLTPEEKRRIPRTMVSYSEQSRQKWAYETSI